MDVLLNNQTVAVIYSFLLGTALSVLFQLYSELMRILGIKKKCKVFGTKLRHVPLIISDFMFFVLVTPICLIVAYGINNGIVRWYLLLSALLGAYAYKITVGALVGKVVVGAVWRIREFFKKNIYERLFQKMREE